MAIVWPVPSSREAVDAVGGPDLGRGVGQPGIAQGRILDAAGGVDAGEDRGRRTWTPSEVKPSLAALSTVASKVTRLYEVLLDRPRAEPLRADVVGIHPDAVGRDGEMVGGRDGAARQPAVGHVHGQCRRHHLGGGAGQPSSRRRRPGCWSGLARLPKRFGETVASQFPRFVALDPPLRLLIRAWPSEAVQNEVAAVWFAPTLVPARLLGAVVPPLSALDQAALGAVEVARGQAELGDDRPANEVDLVVGAGQR